MCRSEISRTTDEVSGQVSNIRGITDNAVKTIRDAAEAIVKTQQAFSGIVAAVEQQAVA